MIFALGAARLASVHLSLREVGDDLIDDPKDWRDWLSFIVFLVGIGCMAVAALLLLLKHLF